jgi:hypothetical protein
MHHALTTPHSSPPPKVSFLCVVIACLKLAVTPVLCMCVCVCERERECVCVQFWMCACILASARAHHERHSSRALLCIKVLCSLSFSLPLATTLLTPLPPTSQTLTLCDERQTIIFTHLGSEIARQFLHTE